MVWTSGKLAGEFLVGDDVFQLGGSDHLLDPRGRIAGIERDIGGTGFHDAKQRGGKVETAVQSQSDEVPAADALRAEEIGDLVRARAQLAIGERFRIR